MPKTQDQWKAEDLYPPEDLQPPDTRLEEVPRDIATFRRPERRPESFFGGSIKRNRHFPVAREIFRSLPEATGRFFGGSIKRNATFRSLPHLAIIIL